MKHSISNNGPMLAISAAALLLAVTLTAGTLATPAKAQHPCEPDANRFCSQFIPNEQDVGACLRKRMRSLSPDCRAAMGAGKGKRVAKKKAQSK
jgi:hypothetical protein